MSTTIRGHSIIINMRNHDHNQILALNKYAFSEISYNRIILVNNFYRFQKPILSVNALVQHEYYRRTAK